MRKFKTLKIKLPFLLPALLLILIFVIVPTFWMFYSSFMNNGEYSVTNYMDIFKDKKFLNPSNFPKFPMGALIHSLIWIFIHLPVTIILGLLIAVLMHNIKFVTAPKTMIVIGMVIPMAVGGIMFRYIFEKNAGIVTRFFEIIGVESLANSWTMNVNTALFALIIGSIWIWTGFTLLVFSAGLTTIPNEYYEAAEIDGASAIKRFFHITVPLLKPTIIFVVIMTVIWELKMFDIVYTATAGGPGGATEVLGLYVFNTAFSYFNFNKASAAATILIVLSLVIAALLMYRRSSERE